MAIFLLTQHRLGRNLQVHLFPVRTAQLHAIHRHKTTHSHVEEAVQMLVHRVLLTVVVNAQAVTMAVEHLVVQVPVLGSVKRTVKPLVAQVALHVHHSAHMHALENAPTHVKPNAPISV